MSMNENIAQLKAMGFDSYDSSILRQILQEKKII